MTERNALNLFATVLTQEAPSSNYRGESEMNRTVIQKIHRGGHDYAVVSPEAMRNALREILAGMGLPMNRRRLHDQDQLAVEFKEFPNADTFADDFLFGFMVADKDAIKGNAKRPPKRDSVLRMNLAVALSAYRFDATFHQSPKNAGDSPWKNADGSALLHREVTFTAYQFPFALALGDCMNGNGPAWTTALLKAMGELSNVAGGHARSFYEMAPRSIVLRLTPSLVAGFDTYGFRADGSFAELRRVNGDDLPGREFHVGGELARTMAAEEKGRLVALGVSFYESPQRLLEAVGKAALGG